MLIVIAAFYIKLPMLFVCFHLNCFNILFLEIIPFGRGHPIICYCFCYIVTVLLYGHFRKYSLHNGELLNEMHAGLAMDQPGR